MTRSPGLRQRWAGLVVAATVVAGLATFTGGGAAATPPDPLVVTEGVLQLHLGSDGNRFTYGAADQSISVNTKCVVSLETSPQRFVSLSAHGGITADAPDGVAANVGFNPYGIGAKYSEGKGTSCGRVDADQSLTLALAGSLDGKVVTEAQLDIEGKFNVVVQADLYRAGQHVGMVRLTDPAFSDNGPDSGNRDNVRWVITTDLDAQSSAPEPFDTMVLSPTNRIGSFSLEGGADGTAAAADPLMADTRDSLFEISTYYGDQLDCAETVTSTGEGITFTITRLTVGECTVDVPYNVTFSRDGTEQVANLQKDESIVDGQLAEFLVDVTWAPEPAQNPVPATDITLPGGSPTVPDWCNPGPAPSGYELPGSFPWCLTGQESAVYGSDGDPDQMMQVTDHFYGKLDPAFSRH